ncbi:hypothetical protein NQ314_017577 [Rhamnusium bicolor]|uniref:Polyprotein n=1 Tax=Rhamnusium bicolor TaxID=1586634 RepID=A0AAV8WTD9_9CUCU|nr:hypothetical protein NQ314_017577 [Rhamnusium bicolor]
MPHGAAAETKTGTALDKINEWLNNNDLRLAPDKTEVIALTGRKRVRDMTVNILDVEVTAKNRLKYLGVYIDRTLSWNCHLEYATAKAERTAMALQKNHAKNSGT